MSRLDHFLTNGWCRFDYDTRVADWVEKTLPAARAAVADPQYADMFYYQDTWFSGVDVIPNDETGMVENGSTITGPVLDFLNSAFNFPSIRWHRGQLSVCYPGYPKNIPNESEAATRYRVKRAAAHVDGLLMQGPERRRFLTDPHQFVLGIPMVDASADAAPLVVWQGSHELMRDAFTEALADYEPEDWSKIDLTDIYHETRKKAFDICERVSVAAKPGESYLMHRLVLHGVDIWGPNASAGPDGRMIAYFRPVSDNIEDWLFAL